jgi:hypothetical protein
MENLGLAAKIEEDFQNKVSYFETLLDEKNKEINVKNSIFRIVLKR